MLNYYHRNLPNVAHVLEPLHKLLRNPLQPLACDASPYGLGAVLSYTLPYLMAQKNRKLIYLLKKN